MGTKLSVLHLEDNVHDAELVQRALQAAGIDCAVTVAHTRTQYLAALEEGPFDVILSDQNVPGIAGRHALELARARRAGQPFVFVSAFASQAQAREHLEATGASGCVPKAELPQLGDVILKAVTGLQPEAEPASTDWYVRAMERLVGTVQELSLARDLGRVMTIVRRAARELTGADGATFVLRDGDLCHYADENAIAPLWKGRRFPMRECISGWVMLNRQAVVIPDIYADARIPADAYRPTFVKSLVMAPIRTADPVGAIGCYWAARRQPRSEEVQLLQALADSTSVALENVQLYVGLERKVTERTASLSALNEELEAFAYSVSHDLQAPLRHIHGYLQMLRDETRDNLSGTSLRYMAVIEESARRMNTLIGDLLQFSRMGRAELKQGRVDMNALLADARRETEREAKGRNIVWHIGDLPEVEGDAAMLRQVWVNLLSNAIKYSGRRALAEIRIGADVRPGKAEFFVQDNGAGFDMKYADKLFGVFQRLHGAEEFEGTGIGLANVRRILARHGGRVWAEGKVDAGATFHFLLPLSGRK